MSEQLTPNDLDQFESDLEQLDEAVKNKDREAIQTLAPKVDAFCSDKFQKGFRTHTKELILALAFALVIAIVVRQMWFELYQIPSGSMRPTYQEKDHLTVSKTQFGLNIPLMPGHFTFDPDLVKRTGTVIFMGDNLPLEDASTWYWSRRYIKRVIGKPGDTLYFYGGQIYGLDKDGQPIAELTESPQMKALEHIPFLSFIGKPEQSEPNKVIIRQMHEPVGRITFTPTGATGEVWSGKEWVADRPRASKANSTEVHTYGDLWGIGNFAMTRLLTPDEVKADPTLMPPGLPSAPLYLELNHTPSFSRINTPLRSIIPVEQKQLDAIMDHMNTTRFDVSNGLATVYGHSQRGAVRLPGVPDGRYQFDRGVAQEVDITARVNDLPADHPLNKRTPERVRQLYNHGVEWSDSMNGLPNRYAYFRDGDLYLLDAPVFEKDDSLLQQFLASEKQREQNSRGYIAFTDKGAPSVETIKAFGIKVPEHHYLVLGDNHAISGDSRIMGFIPEGNLRGVPDVLLWPIGSRWPSPELSSPYQMLTLPRIFVWVVAATVGTALIIYTVKRRKRGYFKRKKR